MAMKLSTGKVAFPIEFDNGDKQSIFYFPMNATLQQGLIASKDKIKTKRIEEMKFDDFRISK